MDHVWFMLGPCVVAGPAAAAAAAGSQAQGLAGQAGVGVGPACSPPCSPFARTRLGLHSEDEDAADGSGCLKSKWGFAPGVDDTLDVSHGG